MAAGRVVGLDLGTAAVRAAELSFSAKGSVTLERFGQVGLPAGAVANGEVNDPEIVGAAIKQLWNSVRFKSKRVVVGVASQKVVVRQVDLPWMPERELRKSLAFQVADVIPMPTDQAIVDYYPLEEFTADSGARTQRIMLVAAVRTMVDATMAAVQRAGLKTEMVDLTPFALLRAQAWTSGGPWSADSEAFVDVGASVTNIVVHQGGVPRFIRILPAGGGDVTGAVGERMGVGYPEAEVVKHTLVLGSEPAHPAARAMEAAVLAWVEEVRGSIDYYLAQPTSQPLRRLVLSGGGARLAGLAERLSLATRLEVVAANPMSRLQLGDTGLSAEQLRYIEPQVVIPVGLALGRAA